MNKLLSFLSGGQSDFLIPLSHQWHGINVAPLLYAVAFLGAFIAITLFGVGLWHLIRRRPAAVIFLYVLVFATTAYAASSTLSGLSAGGAISDTDLFYDVQTVGVGGVKVTGAQLKTYLGTTVNTGSGATGGSCVPGGGACTIAATLQQGSALTASGSALSTDAFKRVTLSNTGSSQTFTLQAGVFAANQGFWVVNINTVAWPIADTGGTYTGPSSLAQNESCFMSTSDGTNWICLGHSNGGTGNATFGTTSGNTTNDVVTMSNTTTGVQDSGVLVSSLAPLASPTFTGTVTMPGSGTFAAALNTLNQPTLFTGTTGPTLSAGQLALGGTFGTPVNPGANGEGQIYLSTVNGVTFQGQGSGNSFNFLSPSGTSLLQITTAGQLNTVNLIDNKANTTVITNEGSINGSLQTVNLTNSNSGASAAHQWAMHNDAGSFTYTYNSSGNSGGNGTSSFTMNNPDVTRTGGMYFQTGGTNALTIDKSQLVGLPAITSDATHTDATVCEDTTSHKLFSGSGTAGICLGTSSSRYKHDIIDLVAGLQQIMGLQPVSYHYNRGFGDPDKPLYGFTAENVVKELPQLVELDKDGRPNRVDYMGVVPVLVRAVQQQQAEIEDLKQRLSARK